jgi:glycerol uptake facilitator protein
VLDRTYREQRRSGTVALEKSMASRPSAGTATTGALAAEAVGTFMFTFSGTATVLAVHNLRGAASGFTGIGDIAISIAFAFGVVAAVYVVASVSGAHINPAVTVALAAVRKFPWSMVGPYIVAQFVGAILAALMNWFMFGGALRESLVLGSTHPGPGIPWYTALVTEFVITLVLMVVVMATAVYERAPGGASQSGLAIGLWVGAAIFLALPVSGGSLNPARTLGPDIVALQFPLWWIYIVGPVAGAIAGAALWVYVLGQGRKEVVESGGPSPSPSPSPASSASAADSRPRP